MFLGTEERKILSFTDNFPLIQEGFGKIFSTGHIYLLDYKSVSSKCHLMTTYSSNNVKGT